MGKDDRLTGRQDDALVGIGGRIRNAREAMGKSREWIANEVNVTAGAVGQWETGTTQPSFSNGVKIARLLGVRERWLAFGEGAQFADDATPQALSDETAGRSDPDLEAQIDEIRLEVRTRIDSAIQPLRQALDDVNQEIADMRNGLGKRKARD